MKLPYIQAESVKGRIGIETQPGQYDIQTQQAELQINSTPAQMNTHSQMASIEIDSDRMWAAFNGGKPTEFINRIYSQMPDIALQGIALIVEKGNRMGDLRNKEDPVPDIALEGMLEGPSSVEVFGPASYKNVDVYITPHYADVQVDVGGVDIQVQTHKPDIEYQRGKINVYMEQYASVRFQVANLDMLV
ncbi:DUF6470 family protein [Paenibacillus sepulcri]|uniref:Uncharacterized protein n=1 Tax=Paenibacillus sepulcri TaxID=359917 RepID=A0ABS7C035_9BACL|nr:hypothetical protein [Paenibacillus sepulcri]